MLRSVIKIIIVTFLEFVQGKIRQLFDVSINSEVRLWQRYTTSSYELMKDLDQSLAYSGIYGGQVSLLFDHAYDESVDCYDILVYWL